jgi:cytochrome oxidase Cu insertion factor (SCO1/SenC/PrrC family)
MIAGRNAVRFVVFSGSGSAVSNRIKENSMALQPGTAAPDFSLASHNGETVSLASYRGKPTIVAFLPFAFTGG